MLWTTRAFSYIRFSSKKQEMNDSLRRQTKDAADLCERHGLVLDESLSFRDLATSGFAKNGEAAANIAKGHLGEFLELLAAGKIPRGSTLILEKLDRLARLHPMQQLPLIDSILKSGIRIATVSPDRFYTDDDIQANPYIIYEIISHAMSGYETSDKTSKRCRDAWENKRREAREKGLVLTKQCPRWLAPNEDGTGFRPLPDKVKVIRRIMKIAEKDGKGTPYIAKTLNDEGVPSFTPEKPWNITTITKLLSDRRLLGEHQSYRDKMRKIPIGEPIIGYYPVVITEDVFNRVQTAHKGRIKNKSGREEKDMVNIFRKLLFDARTGDPFGMFTYMESRKGCKPKRVGRLIVRKGFDAGKGYDKSIRLDTLENAFLKFVRELNPADFSTMANTDAERLASASSALTLVQEKIDTTQSVIRETNDAKNVRPLLEMLTSLEAQKEEAKREYDTLRMRMSSPVGECVADAKTLADMIATSPDPDSIKLKIRARLRQVIQSIWVLAWDEPTLVRCIWAQVFFHDGTVRHIITGNSMTKTPYNEDASVKLPVADTMDLRKFRTLYPDGVWDGFYDGPRSK